MKSFIVLVVIFCAIGLSECMTKDQRVELFVKMANECAAKEGASSADVDELVVHKPASSKGGKCIRACMAENIGMIKDNHVDIDSVANVAAMAFDGNPSKIQVAKDLANECADVTDDDRCEAAAKIMECGQNAAKTRGIITFDDL
ncbi:general odorant-binding protein 28a-like [Sitodiplosis mosellana]|uniref:general odorant-binding protein 28a-like n=1 Tax=Sitodiplosis mosellana TaxID=263140 RepID=UPI0024451234|nr:general odorant-binding protein 28a-like [Sitodiplosis mosellana]